MCLTLQQKDNIMKHLALLLLMPFASMAQVQFKAVSGTDQTAGLQASLTANKNVSIDANYIITSPLVIPSGGSLTGSGSLKASESSTGLLKSRGIYINETGKDKVTVKGITFQPSNGMSVNGWATAVILLQGSTNCIVENNVFDFTFSYAKGIDAVWITNSSFNIVRNNVCKTVGITYAENGSSYNLCENNQIYAANANALGGIGNSKTPNLNNIIRGNYIQDAGRMGLEDQQNSIGSIIQGNVINGTGKGANDGIGISAVANNTLVLGNSLSGYKQYGIEAGGNCGNRVIDNTLVGNATGIIANFTKAITGDPTLIQNNRIKGATTAIQIFGNINPVAVIDANTITDAMKGIDLDWGNGSADIQATNNTFYFNLPTNKTRVGISTFSSLPNGKQSGTRNISGNVMFYSPSAVLGTGTDYGMILATDNTTSQNNSLYGFKKGHMYGITSNGTKPTGLIQGVNNMESL